jgi:drug/metabolite transporter (DMT)-like permease
VHNFVLAVLYYIINRVGFYLFYITTAANITVAKSASTVVTGVVLWAFTRRELSWVQWSAMTLQVLGLFLVEHDSCDKATSPTLAAALALAGSVLLSGAATVYNERTLKGSDVPMPVQNVIMYLFGMILNFGAYALSSKRDRPFFQGFGPPFIAVVLCQAFVGLAVSAVLKHADSVDRSLASACAVGLLYTQEVITGARMPNLTFVAACGVVFIASHMYIRESLAKDVRNNMDL